MRGYQRDRRRQRPELELLRRAQQRAALLGINYSLLVPPTIPERCPALGLRLTPGGCRSNTSPSLDRVDPNRGYAPTNVRVISDRANRLKGNRTLAELEALSIVGASSRRSEFALIARYVEREQLLASVRQKAANEGPQGEWTKLAEFLDRALSKINISDAM